MAETLSYQTIRSANQARELDEQKNDARKKNLLILVLHYLNEEGYIESANCLAKETNIDLNKFEVCDNVDLATVLMEYESFYYIKFSKYPKITKKLSDNERPSKPVGKLPNGRMKREARAPANPPAVLPSLKNAPQKTKRPESAKIKGSTSSRQASTNGSVSSAPANISNGEPMSLQGLVVHGNSNSNNHAADSQEVPAPGKQRGKFGQIIDVRAMLNDVTKLNVEEGSSGYDDRLLKPLGGYVGYNSEWREYAQVISRDIFSQDPNVKWDDIIGLDNAKRLVKEAVVYPIKYPQLFTGILSPWKGLLLYGPPGTGKTLLAKAVATECGTTFFNISASSIVSKWRGDSEKLVRVLFELARFHAPSTIFLDELESLMSQRGSQGGGGEHEGSRRMKTELLVQMDGLAKTDDLVFLLAASNLPWELDHAMLRRLEKRIIVGLPTLAARKAMFQHHLPPNVCTNRESGFELRTDIDYDSAARNTEGYSGSDIRLVCKEAAMKPVRKVFDYLESHTPKENAELHIQLDTVTTDDIHAALRHTKPSARTLSEKYLAWSKEYESV